jgi:hypothetical protein
MVSETWEYPPLYRRRRHRWHNVLPFRLPPERARARIEYLAGIILDSARGDISAKALCTDIELLMNAPQAPADLEAGCMAAMDSYFHQRAS